MRTTTAVPCLTWMERPSASVGVHRGRWRWCRTPSLRGEWRVPVSLHPSAERPTGQRLSQTDPTLSWVSGGNAGYSRGSACLGASARCCTGWTASGASRVVIEWRKGRATMQNQRQSLTARERIRYLTWALICVVLLFVIGFGAIIHGNISAGAGKWIDAGIFIVCFSVVIGGLELWALLRLRSRGRLR
jgi:hypothetical protein